ncbi:LysR family transcriptional regulator [Entomomonas asaccharolytica]|uniref:LysR family transcriptional regulator n=1 Tax=Entomomonas asaccharolytica TaxID=2785331 RepID=A0A974NH10_9GAMM|nr:LysR family transcriptional regulator [Entomomonas asaccharolytica]QQP86670.1 LysR family transcriptional regulator [Entomomonas asaccharolytica]
MQRENLNDILVFLVVARERSFTRAAAKLGVSQSALSHTIRGLESRLNIRLLTRTTRSVSPTEAGEHLLQTVGPHFAEIEAQMVALSELRDKPAGTIRISAAEHPANVVVWPKLKDFLQDYPDINVELTVDYGMIDIVKQRYDAGVRTGELIANDMIAVRIGPDMRMAVVANADYFKEYAIPKTPQDLINHNCINLRLPTYDSIYAWEFEKEGHKQRIHVKGQLTFNLTSQRLEAALAGLGLAYIPEDLARPYIVTGELISVLDDWCPYFAGYYLYYPNRRQASSAFKLLVEALRYREK